MKSAARLVLTSAGQRSCHWWLKCFFWWRHGCYAVLSTLTRQHNSTFEEKSFLQLKSYYWFSLCIPFACRLRISAVMWLTPHWEMSLVWQRSESSCRIQLMMHGYCISKPSLHCRTQLSFSSRFVYGYIYMFIWMRTRAPKYYSLLPESDVAAVDLVRRFTVLYTRLLEAIFIYLAIVCANRKPILLLLLATGPLFQDADRFSL